MIAFTTFEQADAVDARSAEIHQAAMRVNFPNYWADRYSGVTEQDGLYLLPDHPYHRQAANELNITFEEWTS